MGSTDLHAVFLITLVRRGGDAGGQAFLVAVPDVPRERAGAIERAASDDNVAVIWVPLGGTRIDSRRGHYSHDDQREQ